MDVLGDDEAIKLLLRWSFKSARCFTQALGNLPLAIDQAGAYIAESDIEIRDYHAIEAPLLVEPQILRAMESHERGKNLLRFSDHELAEVYVWILRKEKKFRQVISFVERLLLKTSSSQPTPARRLVELSSILIKIDHLVCLAEESKRCQCSNTRRTFTSLLMGAREAFEKAAGAYKLEWARETWVFKSFDVEIQGYRARLE